MQFLLYSLYIYEETGVLMGLWSACGSHPFLGFTKENKQNSKQTTEWHGNCCCFL